MLITKLQDRVDMDNNYLKCNIILGLLKKNIRELCTSDATLILNGNSKRALLWGEKRDKAIRQSLRIVCNIFLKMKDLQPTLTSLSDAYEPVQYDLFEAGIRDMCGESKGEGNEFRAPSAPHQYGPEFKGASDLPLTHLLKKMDFLGDPEELAETERQIQIQNVKGWQEVYSREFDRHVASLGRKQAERRTAYTKSVVPTLEDVQALINFVHNCAQECAKKISANQFQKQVHDELTQALLLKVLIFNRKIVGEMDKIEVVDRLNAQEVQKDSAEFHALSVSDQKFASSFTRLSILSKTKKRVPLLVSKTDVIIINKLIEMRCQADIPESNQFLFAKKHRVHGQMSDMENTWIL
uniref:Glutamate--tRNA ligase n=1 Tax=Lygus hesperus TaxID=30085 RepID=A0A0A9XRU7_LYGHE